MGADVSVISLTHWPATWPMQPAVAQLYGIGQNQSPYQCSSLLGTKSDRLTKPLWVSNIPTRSLSQWEGMLSGFP
jgi:hypothetical protein